MSIWLVPLTAATILAAGFSTANKLGREALSLKMKQSLAAFMRTGDPNNSALLGPSARSQ